MPGGEAEVAGELADRRQLGSGAEDPRADEVGELGAELLVRRHRRLRVDGDDHAPAGWSGCRRTLHARLANQMQATNPTVGAHMAMASSAGTSWSASAGAHERHEQEAAVDGEGGARQRVQGLRAQHVVGRPHLRVVRRLRSADDRPLQELDDDQGRDRRDHRGDDVAVVDARGHQLFGLELRRELERPGTGGDDGEREDPRQPHEQAGEVEVDAADVEAGDDP